MSRQEKKRMAELESTGVAVEDVYGSRKASPLFLCLSKALIIFTVCIGTVTGFCDAFSLNYNKFAIVGFTFVLSVLISLLYSHKKVFYIGYIAFLVVFTIELLRYYLYANSGFQAITNRVREAYGEHFGMTVVRSAEESITNRRLTITIALIFIIAFLIIMYNITVSRYMNFAETLGISFILLEIPLYIGYKPPVISVILVMAGCICTGLLGKGAFNRVTIPGKNSPDFIRDSIFKKSYYTTRGDHRGILMMLAISLVFSFFVCIFSLPVYDRSLGETPEDSAKATLDDTVKILVQNGIYGLFNRYDSINGLNRGALGGVSAVSPDFRTDLVVSFVPYGTETIYLPGFKGVTYSSMNWHNIINTGDFPELGIYSTEYLDSKKIDEIDYEITRSVFKVPKATTGIMQISYVDRSFGMDVYPYITFPGNSQDVQEPFYEAKASEGQTVFKTDQVEYYPIKYANYLGVEDYTDSFVKSMVMVGTTDYWLGRSSVKRPYNDELSGSISLYNEKTGESEELAYQDYVYDVCLKVPSALDRYLDGFIKEHAYFGLTGLNNHRLLTNELNWTRENGAVLDIKEYDSEAGDGGAIKAYGYDSDAIVKKEYATKDEINEFRLEACEAIRKMFLAEYPYTLSPGKTPANEDFVQYFLESQKRGLCSHFASAAVMLLRHMGIPARYVEGYCIPNSLVGESAVRLDEKGEYWLNLNENDYNPENWMYQVEVSDYYAHAWVEVYLEGQGFVPFEVTPPNFEAAPDTTQMTGLGGFFSRLLNVDLGFGSNAAADTSSVIGDDTPVITEKSDMDLSIFVIPFLAIVGIVAFFWLAFILIRKVVCEIKYARYVKDGQFAPLVFARYNELLKRLIRKKVVKRDNTLPLELCEILSGLNLGDEGYLSTFTYAEKVMYSDYKTNAEEYDGFYRKLKEIKNST